MLELVTSIRGILFHMSTRSSFRELILLFLAYWLNLIVQHCPQETHVGIDIYDEVGIGGGASGASGGLLHPYSPKGFDTVTWLAFIHSNFVQQFLL